MRKLKNCTEAFLLLHYVVSQVHLQQLNTTAAPRSLCCTILLSFLNSRFAITRMDNAS